MKVGTDNIRVNQVAPAKPVGKTQQTKAAAAAAGPDDVKISGEAHSLNERSARIAELKAMVAKGENIVHPERIAKAIVSDALSGAL